MTKLTQTLAAWPDASYKQTLKQELEALDKSVFPLQQGLQQSSYVGTAPIHVVVIGSEEDSDHILSHVSLFYTGIIAGCSCADDPSPVDEINEHCEMMVVINKADGEARFELIN